ncbi:ubiquitin-protein ligase E4 [Patellaria atrata CBS 101060]|uniref:Pre-mRNA-processing factor 19 n=1 Tax=Patellaria atrata CBS 101060 TaxID=1346257 RepID=A0A9P4SA44_9PEZI|nr:ubiquitin-protein ligase E4 [Patellaria atrata CBS 101060]
MLCAISGEAPEVPVASRKSGNVFEKRLIEAYIAEHGTDPVNGEELSIEDLVELKTARVVRPRPPTMTSIPSLLSAFQNEWDALALETYTLKQQLAQTRQELSTALYQHDAAVRVIARVVKERDEARDALSKITISAGSGASNGDAMQVDGASLPDALVEKIDETHLRDRLSSTRRKRPVPEDWATEENIQSFESTLTTDPVAPGSRTLALNQAGDMALLGGEEGSATLYSLPQKAVTGTLDLEKGIATDGLWWNDRQVVATSTGAVKVFEDVKEIAQLGSHAGAATAVSLHPCGDLLASTGVDKSYMLYDLSTMKVVSHIFTETELTCGEFHPDGHLFAAGGRNGEIKVFDVKTGQNVANFDAEGPVQAFSFSENGTWFAVATKGETSVQIWDIRKSKINQIDVGTSVNDLKWDYTARFLAAAGSGSVAVLQYTKASKSWSEPIRKAVSANALHWGVNAKSLVLLESSGSLNVLSSF